MSRNILAKIMAADITIVSLGPGDKEMITLKALHTLEGADKIFCPITRRGEVELSRSGDMIRSLGIDPAKIEHYYLPMSHDRELTLKIYNDVAMRCIDLSQQDLKIVITAEGDGGFYSSSQYISEIIASENIKVKRIAGVPAFIDCAALASMHIASGERALEIIPSLTSVNRIVDRVAPNAENRANIVLMKLSQSQEVIKEAIVATKEFTTIHYFENRGFADEFYSCDTETILARKFPYFSILIFEAK